MPRDDPTGHQVLIDLASAAARATDAYANFVLTTVDDHVIRLSVMTEPFYWHRHPDSDETFLVIEGKVLLRTAREIVELEAGQLYTVPAGLAHVTSPVSARSVNITVERAGMSTERLDGSPDGTGEPPPEELPEGPDPEIVPDYPPPDEEPQPAVVPDRPHEPLPAADPEPTEPESARPPDEDPAPA